MRFFGGIERRAGSDSLAVLLPGYTGGSGVFNAITGLLGSDLLSVVYPGHGRDYKRFPDVDARQWEDAVAAVVEREERRYANLLLVGYSMGGALALICGKAHPKLLFAPAVQERRPSGSDRPGPVNPRLKALCDAEDIEVLKHYRASDGFKPLGELWKIEAEAASLAGPFPGVFAFLGKNDLVVPHDKAMAYLLAREAKVFSTESTHAVFYDDATADLVQTVGKLVLSERVLRDFA